MEASSNAVLLSKIEEELKKCGDLDTLEYQIEYDIETQQRKENVLRDYKLLKEKVKNEDEEQKQRDLYILSKYLEMECYTHPVNIYDGLKKIAGHDGKVIWDITYPEKDGMLSSICQIQGTVINGEMEINIQMLVDKRMYKIIDVKATENSNIIDEVNLKYILFKAFRA